MSSIEKVQMFGVDVLKPLFKITRKFELNKSNYNVYVIDVIPDIASTMKSFERQNFPIKGQELIAHLVHNQVYGIFVGFYDLTKERFVSSDFFRLRSISKYERESTLFNQLVNQAEMDEEGKTKLLEPYNQALFFAKDFYTEDQNCQQEYWPRDKSLKLSSECLANRKRSTASEDYASDWEIIPYTIKFMDNKRTIGANLRRKHEQSFDDFRWQSALCEFDEKYLEPSQSSQFQCDNVELMKRSLAPPLRAIGQQMMHWEEIQRGICYKTN